MYQAIDIKKYKTDEQITNVTAHNLRTSLSNNVNPKKTKLNKFFVGSADMDFDKLLADKLSSCGKFRKDAVKVVNLVFSASPEFFKNGVKAKEWETLTQKFVEETFGKENILYSVVHYDEKTPHFHISIIPIDPKGKLNASHWFDGRAKLKAFHDNYHKAVKHLGLKRGEERKKPTYTELNDYYKKVNASSDYEQKLEEKLDRVFNRLDSPKIQDKLNPWGLLKQMKPMLSSMGKAISHFQAKAKEFERVVKKLDKAEEKIADYEAKFEEMGLKPTLTYSECKSYKYKLFGTALAVDKEPKALKREGEDLELTPQPTTTKKIKPR